MEIWQLARVLCNDIYEIIEGSGLKNNFRLVNQIDGSSGSVMDILLKVLKEMEIESLYSFYMLRKHPVEKQDHNYIGFWTENSFQMKNSKF